MDTQHLTPSGGQVAQCADEAFCTTLTCAVCLKEIPADAIRLADTQEYVHHFCGLECLDRWRKQVETGRESP